MTSLSLRSRPFFQVDVFTDTPYYGNALAVVLDGTDLSDEAMQRFAAWMNLAETTFLLPPTPEGAAAGADYRVRIFTPARELPFAGHPTLGSCHAWLQAGGQPQGGANIVQECAVGLVRLRRDGDRLAFAAPKLTRTEPAPAVVKRLASALGISPTQIVAAQDLCNGPRQFGVLLDDPHTVLDILPDPVVLRGWLNDTEHSGVGIAARYAHDSGTPAQASDAVDLEVRFFANDLVICEDPITGSFNASLAQWLIADGHMPQRYTAAQGRAIGRDGRVYIERDTYGQVWVGGNVVTCIAGSVTA